MNWKDFFAKEGLTVPVLSSLERIRSAKPPISPCERNAMEALIEAEVPIVEFDARQQFLRKLEETKARRADVEQWRSEIREMRHKALAHLAAGEAEPHSLAKALLNWTGAAATGAAEFLVSWATLPAALDIPRNSAMGITISLAPVIAFVALEQPIDRFLRWASPRAVHAFHTALAAGIGWVAWSLALARNEITRVLGAILRGDLNVQFREAVLDNFILALSVVLVVVGATFLAYAFRFGGNWLAVFRARHAVNRLERADRKHADQEAELKGEELELAWAAEEKPSLIAQVWRRQALLELAGLAVAFPTVDHDVDIRLGLEPRLSKGTVFAAAN
jgi:hypothetical protein